MKIQKLLYFAWIEYYKVYGESLFDDRFYAWRYGPVVESVYQEYKSFSAAPIAFVKKPDMQFDKGTIMFLEEFASSHLHDSAGDLVNKTHEAGKPWMKVYRPELPYVEIPFKLIRELECQKN
ncbi:MAG: DUF4065 domain-containing protein [archaeon]|nr:DUF4065 domain-containing protein [archaeon]